MKKKIISAILTVVMVLSVVVVVPSLYTVETEAFNRLDNAVYNGSRVFTAAELYSAWSSANTQNTTVGYDPAGDGDRGLQVRLNGASDPFVYFNLSVNTGAYPYCVIVWADTAISAQAGYWWGYYWWRSTTDFTSGGFEADDKSDVFYHTGETNVYKTDVFKISNSGAAMTGLRLDYVAHDTQTSNLYNSGTKFDVWINSIGFFATETAARAYAAERSAVCNNSGTYDMTQYLDTQVTEARLEGMTANNMALGSSGGYNSSQNAIHLTSSSSNDPYYYMKAGLNLANFTHMSIVWAADGLYGAPLEIYFFTNGGGLGGSVQYTCEQANTYFCQVYSIQAVLGTGTLDYIRFDSPGSNLYIKAICFSNSWDGAYNLAVARCSANGMGMFNLPAWSGTHNFAGAWSGTSATVPTPAAQSTTGYTFNGYTVNPGGATCAASSTTNINGSTSSPVDVSFTPIYTLNYGTVNIAVNNTNSNVAADQSYLFTVSGTGYDGSSFTTTVAIIGNGQATFYLPAGNYTVTCKDDWSWRYVSGTQTQTSQLINSGQANTLTFTYTSKNEKWLNGFDAE